MPFLQIDKPQRLIPPSGPRNAKIVIVGEAGGAYENAQLKPFVGPAGSVLEQCMHAAGLIRSEVYLTNVVKWQPSKNDISPYYNPTKGTFTPAGVACVEALREEIDLLPANVIVACGATSFSALAGMKGVMKYRGYIFESIGLKEPRKILPIIHPAAALRGQYLYRHLIAADLKKAKAESTFRELRRPERQLVYEYASVEECLQWIALFENSPRVCIDIEVINFELACIGLSNDQSMAVSVPVGSQWSLDEEIVIFRALQRVLGNPTSIKVFQNGVFDIHFLLTKCGLEVRGPIEDIMIAHHIMYPELRKSLAFLGSIYCGSQAYWKDMIKFENIKEES